ncbi:MAG TPA: glycosyltransferase family 39 protein [Anaerolineae bacterium]|nr:glycosyltransferase family 39 protein [Anaerolineae bacterium]
MKADSRAELSYREQAITHAWLDRGLLLFALLLGFFVRVNQLAAQSLWNDEGTSVALAGTSISAIISAAAQDIHPPLYYLLLHAWVQAAGVSEFAVRFLSVFAGVLVIAVTFRVASEFFNPNVAILVAFLSALNPFQVYYAQETRMYIWVTLFAALSVWMMVLMFRPPPTNPIARVRQTRTRSLALVFYLIFTLAALYTNYYAFTLVVFENLAFGAWLLWAWRGRRPRIGHSLAFWILAQIVIVLAYVPWLIFAQASLTAWPGISEPMLLFEMTWRILSAFVTGLDTVNGWQVGLVAVYVIFFLIGLLPVRDLYSHSVWGVATCALWAIVPLLAMYFVSLSRPAYNPKFLLLATPGFLILIARGMVVLYRLVVGRVPNNVARRAVSIGALLVGALFAIAIAWSLTLIYTDPRLQRDDYRGIVNYINAVATNRDVVIVDAPGQLDVVRYYYHGAAQLETLPIGRPVEQGATQERLDDLLKNKENLFAILWATEQADPQQYVEGYLGENAFKASDVWHGNVRLAEYATGQELRGRNSKQVNAEFGDELALNRYSFNDASSNTRHIIPAELLWEARKTPAADYKFYVHLLDESKHLVSQYDAPLLDGSIPTSLWSAKQQVDSRVGVIVPPGTPLGEYDVYLGVYNPESGARLPVKARDASGGGEDGFFLGRVHVDSQMTLPQALFLTQRVNADLGAVRLLGYNLERSSFARGEFVSIVLYWQASETPHNDINLNAQLLDASGKVIASERAFEAYPTSKWSDHEIVRDVHALVIPPDASVGDYKIVVSDGTRRVDVTHVQVR